MEEGRRVVVAGRSDRPARRRGGARNRPIRVTTAHPPRRDAVPRSTDPSTHRRNEPWHETSSSRRSKSQPGVRRREGHRQAGRQRDPHQEWRDRREGYGRQYQLAGRRGDRESLGRHRRRHRRRTPRGVGRHARGPGRYADRGSGRRGGCCDRQRARRHHGHDRRSSPTRASRRTTSPRSQAVCCRATPRSSPRSRSTRPRTSTRRSGGTAAWSSVTRRATSRPDARQDDHSPEAHVRTFRKGEPHHGSIR